MVDLGALVACARPADLLPADQPALIASAQPDFHLIGSAEFGPSGIPGSPALFLAVADGRGVVFGVPAVIEHGRLRRARAGDGVSEALLARLGRQDNNADLRIQRFESHAVESGEVLLDPLNVDEQVVVGDQALVAWQTLPRTGPVPAADRMQTFARAQFDGAARPWAVVRLATSRGDIEVCRVQQFVSHLEHGWVWAVEEVRSSVDGDGSDQPPFLREVARLVARMHVALASAGSDVASMADAREWRRRADDDIIAVGMDPSERDRALGLVAPLADAAGTLVIDVHGQLDMAHVVRHGDGRYLIVGLDGDPRLPVPERMTRLPAAYDIASMLASLDHVGRVALGTDLVLDDDKRGRVAEWVEDAQVTFVDEYFHALVERDAAELLDDGLITPFQVQRACRDVRQPASGEAHWWHDQAAALHALLQRAHL